jgi:hypothetical protein|tara:strand:- start:877 stop:1068 length:192 start_codon:yes stop_codon:yes gene_type:complete
MNKEKYERDMEREIYRSMLDMIDNGDIVEDMTDAAARKRILHVKTVLHRMLDANAFLSVGDEQ